jgi:hypothetical protein
MGTLFRALIGLMLTFYTNNSVTAWFWLDL